MTAPTHTSFSLLFLLGIGLLLGIAINPSLAIFAVIGALLPDVDTEKSVIGRLLFPLAGYMERKLGHRQATHSFFALALLSLMSSPLAYLKFHCFLALLSGYLSHLLIDTINKLGVPLFYPSPVRAVMPKPEKWRIAVGSKGESILFCAISVVALLLLPINRVGLFKSLHWLIKDTPSAIADYRSWADKYKVYAHVTGTFNVSQRPILAQFEVLGIENRNTLVVYDERADKIYTVGTDKNASLYPKKIHCVKGEPIDVITKKIHLQYELLGNLASHIPQQGQTFIKGVVKTTDRIILNRDPDTHQTIEPSINSIILQYARRQELSDSQVNTVFVLSGDVYLRTILPAERRKKTGSGVALGSGEERYEVSVPYEVNRLASLGGLRSKPPRQNSQWRWFRYDSSLRSESTQPGASTPLYEAGHPYTMLTAAVEKTAPPSRTHTVEMYIHNVQSLDEILVREGEYIEEGQLIACLRYDDKRLKLQEQTLKKKIAFLQAEPIDSTPLFLSSQEVKAKKREYQLQQEIFKATKKLYSSSAISQAEFIKEQQKGERAEAAVVEAEQEYKRAKEELKWEQKSKEYILAQAILKLKSLKEEREGNKIYSKVYAKVLLIRTHTIHDNNLTIAIKLLVTAPPPAEKSKQAPKINPLPPPKKSLPEKENLIRVMENTLNRAVSFFINPPYIKKTHTQNVVPPFPKGGWMDGWKEKKERTKARGGGFGGRGKKCRQSLHFFAVTPSPQYKDENSISKQSGDLQVKVNLQQRQNHLSSLNILKYINNLSILRRQPTAPKHHYEPSFFT